MKALILAAGNANKAQPMTTVLPKPMIPVVHKPAMELMVDQLRAHGIDEIIVSTSYLGPMIESYFRDGHRFGVRMAYSFEGYELFGSLVEHPLGGAGAMRKVQNHSRCFDDAFVVLRGDVVADVDFTELLRLHRERKALATVAVKQLPAERLSRYGVAFLDDDGRITEYADQPEPRQAAGGHADAGIYVFDPAIFAHIPADDVVGLESRLLPALVGAGAPVFGAELACPWLDVGQLEDYYSLVMRAMEGSVPGFDLPGRLVRPGLRVGPNVKADFRKVPTVGPVYVGGSAEIADGCNLIGPVVVGAGAILEAGVRLESSVVLDYTRVVSRAEISHKVVGTRFCFCADGTVLDDRHTDIFWLFSDARSQAPSLTAEQAALRGG